MDKLPEDCIVEIGLQLGEFCDGLALGLTCKKIYKILSYRIAKYRYDNDRLSICNVYVYEKSYIVYSARGNKSIGAQIFTTDNGKCKYKSFNRTVIDRYIQIFKNSNTTIYFATNTCDETKWINSSNQGSIYLELNVDWNTDKITRVDVMTKHQMIIYGQNSIFRSTAKKFDSAPFRQAYEYFYKGTLCDKFFGEYFIRAVEVLELADEEFEADA